MNSKPSIFRTIMMAVPGVAACLLAAGLTACSTTNQGVPMDTLSVGGMPLYSPVIKSRAITAENQTGAPGAGGKELGGRKGLPCLWNLEKDQTYIFAEIDGPGVIRHIWITVDTKKITNLRNLIVRMYWDGQEQPSVEAPLGDLFGVSHGRIRAFESMFLTTAEGRCFNSYFPMPFAKKARMTVTNETGEDAGMFFYQVDYTIGDTVTEDTPYFHAQFRRVPKTTLKEDYVILDGVRGKGRFLGVNVGLVDRYHETNTWWGEGEVKIYLDGDTDYPTICGTGSEDYALSAWGLGEYANLEAGSALTGGEKEPDSAMAGGKKYVSYYRFHGRDPVYFSEDIKVTVQQLGNDGSMEPATPDGPFKAFIEAGEYLKEHPGGNYERVDDMCSTAYWYQTLPTQPFPPFPDKALRMHDITEGE
jgi:hypothetical protein